MNIIAKTISWLFLPMLAPVYALLIVFYIPAQEINWVNMQNLFIHDGKNKLMLLSLFFFLCFVGPCMVILVMRLRGMITSVQMPEREQRIMPAIMTNMFGIMLCYFLWTKLSDDFTGKMYLISLALGSCISIFVVTIITSKWKISLHALGMGILCGWLFAYYQAILIPSTLLIPGLMLLSGVVISMRLYLKAHSIQQVLAGYAVGFIFPFFLVIIFQKIYAI